MNTFYRIGIIDNFRNTHIFFEMRIYGEQLEIVNFSITKAEKELQKSTDSISLFINFKLVFETKIRSEAVIYLKNIINNAPQRFSKEIKLFNKDLIDSIL